ncbi:hypothetical protein [Viridibacillus sp. FSL R5-0888]
MEIGAAGRGIGATGGGLSLLGEDYRYWGRIIATGRGIVATQ